MSTTTTTSSATNPLTTSSSQMGGRGRRSRRMAKGSMRASRSASRSMALAGGRRRKRRGGQSAHEYVQDQVGTGDQQYKNVFEGSVNNSGNAIVGLSGQQSVRPVQTQLGGKRRTKRGGYWGQVLSTALVPFGLWAAQNRFSKRRGHARGGKTRKHRK